MLLRAFDCWPRLRGIFAETAGGVVISALKQLAESGAIQRDEETVALITGSGFEDDGRGGGRDSGDDD